MYGCYDHKLDAKGRLCIPSLIREDLGDVFYVTTTHEGCLTAYSKDSWDNIKNRVKEMPMHKHEITRAIFSNAHKCDLDSQGRFLLPQKLRDKVGLSKDVTIVGGGLYVQFWDTQKYVAVDEVESSPAYISNLIRELNL